MAKAALAPSLILALGVIAAPIAAYAANEPAAKGTDYYTKKVCDTIRPTGSRLGGARRCRSKADRDQAQQEARQVIERVQTFSPSFCPPQPWLC